MAEKKNFFLGLLDEFKAFAIQGNAVDLAVGVVIGAAFGSIVKSLVEDVIMPPLGLVTGGADYSSKWIVLQKAIWAQDKSGNWYIAKPENDLRYGVFLNNVINFLIVAIAIFMLIKLMNMMKRKPPEAPATPPPPTPEEKLLMEIRDAIKERNAPIP